MCRVQPPGFEGGERGGGPLRPGREGDVQLRRGVQRGRHLALPAQGVPPRAAQPAAASGQRPSAALAATVCQLLLLAPPDLLCGPNDPSDARRLLRWLCRLMAHSLPHWNHHTSSGERRPQPQDYTEAIHTDGTTRSLPLPKASYSGCGGAKPCPVPLELARVLLSRVSLPQALEALRYIREHREDGK